MAADRYMKCPRCMKQAKNDKAAGVAAVRATYGAGLATDYEAALREAQSMPGDAYDLLPDSLMEWHEFTLVPEDGNFTVQYRGECSRDGCGFVFTYQHTETVPF